MLAATFVLALSSVLFKFFAVRDDFWSTTFWTFVGEGLFGAAHPGACRAIAGSSSPCSAAIPAR